MSNKYEELGELTKFECLKCVGLIITGVVLFFFIPDEVGILGWILFGVGTLLLAIGVFRLAAFIHKPESKRGSIIWFASFVIAAIVIQIIGFWYLYSTGGTGKGDIIGTLALIFSLGLIIFTVDEENGRMFRVNIVVGRVLCVVVLGLAVYLCVRDGFSDASVHVGTMLLIEFCIMGKYAKISLRGVSDKKRKKRRKVSGRKQ